MTLDRETTLDRLKGTLVGCAVGASAGTDLSGCSGSWIAHGSSGRACPPSVRRGVPPGTRMVAALAQSILEFGRFDSAHTTFKFRWWAERFLPGESGDHDLVGRPCDGSGEPAETRSEDTGPSAGGVPFSDCAAVVRACVIGLRHHHDPEELLEAAVEQARITLSSRDSQAGSAALAFAVASGITCAAGVPDARLLERTSAFASRVDPGVGEVIARLARPPAHPPVDGVIFAGRGGSVAEVLSGALLFFSLNARDFEEAVANACASGEDPASRGALAGAVSGAYNGLSGIPPALVKDLAGREYLESLAGRLFTLTPAAAPERRPFF